MIGCEQEDTQIEVNYQKGDGRMNFYDIFKYVRETCRKIVPLSLNGPNITYAIRLSLNKPNNTSAISVVNQHMHSPPSHHLKAA